MEDTKILGEILETVNFIKDNAVTRDEFSGLKNELTSDIKGIKSTMVTKDYLDEKLADLRGDLTIMMRKEDTKLKTLVEVLHHKKVLSPSEAKRIVAMEPFPLV